MARAFFLKTNRVGFSEWTPEDRELAEQLWGDADVTQWICASGRFSPKDIEERLEREIENLREHRVQYWPIFELQTNELIGCCGLRTYREGQYEIGFHLRPPFWRQGYAVEAARAVIGYAFTVLQAESLFAGHHPCNAASRRVLDKLGFRYIGDEFYEPTGLFHPSYELKKEERIIKTR